MSTRITIIGAGFVGLYTAKLLAKRLRGSVTITVIDPHDHFLFTPRLIDTLADPNHPRKNWSANLSDLGRLHGFTFVHGRARSIHREQRSIDVERMGSVPQIESMPYDILVIAYGSKPCFYGIPGAEDHAIPLKNEEDARHIHRHIEKQIERAKGSNDREDQRHALSFITVGAGPTGIEATCVLQEFVQKRLRTEAPELASLPSWTIVQAGPQILPGFPLPLVEGVSRELKKRGIEIRVSDAVTGVNADEVCTSSTTFKAGMTLWTAGIQANTLDIEPELHRDRGGYLSCDRYFVLADRIFGAGDAILYKEGNMTIPKNAQTAMLMAPRLAENVVRSIQGAKLIPFRYTSKGNLITLGKTGFFDFGMGCIQTRLVPFIRDIAYQYRFKQLTKP